MHKAVMAINYQDQVWLRIHFECQTSMGGLFIKTMTEYIADLVAAEALDIPPDHTILITDEQAPLRLSPIGSVLAEVVHIKCRLIPYDTTGADPVPDIGVMNVFLRTGGAGLFDVEVAYLDEHQAQEAQEKFEFLKATPERGHDAWAESFGEFELEDMTPHSINSMEVLCEEIVDSFITELSLEG